MAEVLSTIGRIHGFVRCKETFVVGERHAGIVLNNWGEELDGDIEDLKKGLLQMFGEINIDMGLIVRRGEDKLEVGGFSSAFFIPSWNLVKQVRPVTIERIRVLYPNEEVVENKDLRRSN